MITNVKKSSRKDFIWNLLGSVINTATTMILLIVTTRIIGVNEAGIYAIAIATAQMWMIVGNFGVRAYQVTDLTPRFKLCDYYTHRIITCTIMVVISIGHVLQNSYDENKAIIVVLICVWKMIDALADVFEGYMQQQGFLYKAGQALFVRSTVYCLMFIITLIFTKNLMLASCVGLIGAIFILVVVNILPTIKMEKLIVSFHINNLFQITKVCLPLFASLFIMIYIVNAPKYAIDRCLSGEMQTYYNIIYTPAQVINLLSSFIFKPVLTTLAESWLNEDIHKYKILVSKLLLIICGLTIITILGAYLIGVPVLSFLYGVDISEFKSLLIIILVGGGFNAVAYLLYYALTAIRIQNWILVCYIGTFLISIGLPSILVQQFEMLGAVMSYVISMGVLSLTMFLLMYGFIKYTARRGLNESTRI